MNEENRKKSAEEVGNDNDNDDLPAGKELRRCVGHRGAVFRAKFTQDGQYCMTAGHDKTVRLWNPHKSVLDEKQERPKRKEKKATGEVYEQSLLIKTWDNVHSSAVYDIAV